MLENGLIGLKLTATLYYSQTKDILELKCLILINHKRVSVAPITFVL